MIKEYLNKRKVKVQELLDYNQARYDHNQIAIEKNKKQINELLNEVDEATNIFSVVAREDNGFKSKEIQEIEEKLAVYNEDNEELKAIIDEAKEEITCINQCLDSFKEKDSYESTNESPSIIEEDVKIYNMKKEENTSNVINKDIIDKIKLCKNLVNLDPQRTIIELDNILDQLK